MKIIKLWKSIKNDWKSMRIYANPWKSMKIDENHWKCCLGSTPRYHSHFGGLGGASWNLKNFVEPPFARTSLWRFSHGFLTVFEPFFFPPPLCEGRRWWEVLGFSMIFNNFRCFSLISSDFRCFLLICYDFSMIFVDFSLIFNICSLIFIYFFMSAINFQSFFAWFS